MARRMDSRLLLNELICRRHTDTRDGTGVQAYSCDQRVVKHSLLPVRQGGQLGGECRLLRIGLKACLQSETAEHQGLGQ